MIFFSGYPSVSLLGSLMGKTNVHDRNHNAKVIPGGCISRDLPT